MMRIITGKARGVRLATLDGNTTRPTAERAKEAVFSMLQFSLAGTNVLDLFGGSGQLGLEAVSRGAAHATLVDASKDAVRVISENVRRTRSERETTVLCADALRFLEGYRGAPFEIVFLDPPYAAGLVPQCLSLLLKRALLAPGAWVVCETAGAEDVFANEEQLAKCFSVEKQNRYGAALVSMLMPVKGEN